MNCAVHTDREAAGYCRNCGKPLCSACVRPVRDVLYCEECLAQSLGHAQPGVEATPAMDTATPGYGDAHAGSPAVAFVLGFLFPGLGAVYNRQYNKALIHIIIFATFIFGLSSDLDAAMKAVLGILLAGFIFYMAFDSMHTAQAQRGGEFPADALAYWSKERPVGPIILIVAGALLLLNNFGLLPLYRIERLWPLILIAIGVLMFRNRLSAHK